MFRKLVFYFLFFYLFFNIEVNSEELKFKCLKQRIYDNQFSVKEPWFPSLRDKYNDIYTINFDQGTLIIEGKRFKGLDVLKKKSEDKLDTKSEHREIKFNFTTKSSLILLKVSYIKYLDDKDEFSPTYQISNFYKLDDINLLARYFNYSSDDLIKADIEDDIVKFNQNSLGKINKDWLNNSNSSTNSHNRSNPTIYPYYSYSGECKKVERKF